MTTVTAVDTAAIDRDRVGRWIWFFAASLFVATALVGFFPRSLEILTGVRRNPPLVIHVHAATMAAWLGLLFFQTLLVALRRPELHRTLGLASFVIGPAMAGSMIAATLFRFGERVSLGENVAAANVLLNQGRAIFYFVLFFTWAMWVRKQDSETHKRMIFLATVGPFTAAFARMTWLPNTWPENPLSSHLYMFGLLLPAIAYDVYRQGRPHPAWLIGLALMLPWVVATQFLWNQPWWTATAARLMGY
jgi:hypothetical protein